MLSPTQADTGDAGERAAATARGDKSQGEGHPVGLVEFGLGHGRDFGQNRMLGVLVLIGVRRGQKDQLLGNEVGDPVGELHADPSPDDDLRVVTQDQTEFPGRCRVRGEVV